MPDESRRQTLLNDVHDSLTAKDMQTALTENQYEERQQEYST